MRFVIDASAALYAALNPRAFTDLQGHEPLAPALIRAETTSALHEMLWRGSISTELAELARTALRSAPIRVREPSALRDAAWAIADELGWAKTYDAEYVALARLLGIPLVTQDARLARGAARVVEVRTPADL